MRRLSSLAWRSLVSRRLRSLLTLIGIALGVGVLFASLATNAGIETSIDRTVRDIVGRADLRISAFRERGLADDTVEMIQNTPGVEILAPAVERRTYLGVVPGRVGPALPPPVTVLGIDPATDGRIRDVQLVVGAPLARADERSALVTERLAREDGIALGQEISILGGPEAGPIRVRVVGILAGSGPLVGARRSSGRRPDRPRPRGVRARRRQPRRPATCRRSRSRAGHRRARCPADRRALHPVPAPRYRGLPPGIDRRLPGDHRPGRRGRAVRRRVPDLQHPVDDRHRTRPRGRPPSRRRDDPPAGRQPHPARGGRPRGGRFARWPGRRGTPGGRDDRLRPIGRDRASRRPRRPAGRRWSSRSRSVSS